MGFYADLHLHSKHSRATSRDADLEHMALWARKKGVAVLGTGDFTHPAWMREIEDKLVPAEPGLFRLRPELERALDDETAGERSPPPRFLLEVEISTIYKKDGKTRKVHHLLYAPDLEKAKAIARSLERIGNLASDGRPILGLDSRHLLEITLQAGDGCFLIPAHIWTPWFAVLGSMSGFDAIEDCYGDLSPHIFAIETGLSSDPPMNRRLSRLDRYTLVSNSDAHSPPKIGREACAFDCDMDYFAMRRALETGAGYGGTVEFFAEEGKYHLDGHRDCGVCWTPEETRRAGGACPICSKPLTLGVLHRVSDLADREENGPAPAPAPFKSLVPLKEVLAEIEGTGAKSRAVQARYESLVARVGSELHILERAPLDEVGRAGDALLAEAIGRMRAGKVIRTPGYDGEYGVIRLFDDGELAGRDGGASLFAFFDGWRAGAAPAPDAPARPRKRRRRGAGAASGEAADVVEDTATVVDDAATAPSADFLAALDPVQRRAAEIADGPLAIIAGPGTGKTRVLTHRLAFLVAGRGAPPERCLAITFTNRAAAEMRERLQALLPDRAAALPVLTFHALGLAVLREHGSRLGLADGLRVAGDAERRALLESALGASNRRAEAMLERLSRLRRTRGDAAGRAGDDEGDAALARYTAALRAANLVDFDDLVELPIRLLEENPDLLAVYRERFRWISVDEFQDVDALQYRLLRLLAPPEAASICAIGDPDQSIYGFRGADGRAFARFHEDYPAAREVRLERNYRSSRAIADGALQMMAPETRAPGRRLEASGPGPETIEIHELASERAEALFVVEAIEALVGGSTFFAFDSGRVESASGAARSFGDFAVLYRSDSLCAALVEAFQRSGIPFQKRSHGPLAEAPGVEDLVKAVEEESDAAGAATPLADIIDRAAHRVREREPRIDLSLPALRVLAARHAGDPAGFRSALALGLDLDLFDPRAEAVSLLTLHAAKGLEFPVVFIVACEDGVLPLRFGSEDADLAEERRLFFVGMTRARERLILSHARRRAWRGPAREMRRSPFLDAIEERLLTLEAHRREREAGPRFEQLTLFDGA
jgi:DNA helicase-2/ATP-dependent DNA helicase PcrA